MSNYKASEIASAIQNLRVVISVMPVWIGTQEDFEELATLSNKTFYCILQESVEDDNETEEPVEEEGP